MPLIFQREFYAKALSRLQPYLFGMGITTMAIGMSFAGSYGVPRRHWDVEFSGSAFAPAFDSGAHVMLGLLGVGAVIAFTAVLLFVLLVVAAVFFGRSTAGRYALRYWLTNIEADDPTDTRVRVHVLAALQRAGIRIAVPEYSIHTVSEDEEHRTPGTLVLVLVFLASFAVYYFANWLWLSDVWHVR